MGAAVKITRADHTAEALRGIAAKSHDGAQVRRLLALALILEGHPRRAAAERSGMDRQTLRDWVHRYNKGPDPEKHKVVRWRCVDLREEVARRFTVTVTEGTIGKWLRKMDLTRLQPRPFHPKKDAAAQEAFKKTLPAW